MSTPPAPDLVQTLFIRQGIPSPEPEFRFHATRKWRFDYAWPEKKIALEIEGGMWAGGRHTSPKGFFNDMEKKNAAAILGWRMLYVTPKAIDTVLSVYLVRQAIGAQH